MFAAPPFFDSKVGPCLIARCRHRVFFSGKKGVLELANLGVSCFPLAGHWFAKTKPGIFFKPGIFLVLLRFSEDAGRWGPVGNPPPGGGGFGNVFKLCDDRPYKIPATGKTAICKVSPRKRQRKSYNCPSVLEATLGAVCMIFGEAHLGERMRKFVRTLIHPMVFLD